MAVIQYSALINQMRGKLGGSVFNKSRNAFTLQRKQQQPKGSRGFQSEVRNFFSVFQRSWKSLTNAQRVNWRTCAQNNPTRDRFGNLTVLSGYNQFIKASMLAEYAGAALPTSPFTGAAPANLMELNSIDDGIFQQNADGSTTLILTVSVTTSVDGAPWYVLVDVSIPVSDGVMTYHGRWTHFNSAETTEDFTVIGSVQNLGDRYPMPSQDSKVFIRVRLLHATSGTVVQEFIEPFTVII